MLLSSNFMNTYLLPYLNSSEGRKCRAHGIEFYGQFLKFNKPCTTPKSKDQCERFKNSARKTIEWISKIKVEDDTTNFSYYQCLMQKKENPHDELIEFFDDITSSINCQTQKVGSSNYKKGYILNRVKTDEYEVKMNLNFKPISKRRKYKNFTRKCLKRMNELTKLPPSGAELTPRNPKLKFVLTDNTNIPAHDISIMPPDYRSDSASWESDIDCETISHEILHLLGLMDCYHESDTDPSTGESIYPCRKIGREDSIMNDHHLAWNRARSTGENILFADQMRMIIYQGCKKGGKKKQHKILSMY